MRQDLIDRLEYAKLCIDRALLQERGKMEKLGKWYIKQNIEGAQRALDKASFIVKDKQLKLFK